MTVKTEILLKSENEAKPAKIYRVKNTEWFCQCCDVYCNSESQFDVHLISKKHKDILNGVNVDCDEENVREEERELDVKTEAEASCETKIVETPEEIRARSIEEIRKNPLALQHNIDAVKYLIPEDKRNGKFEKFGFYCKTCNAFMTGQIQLIMHVKGAKHYYYNPNEIPGYKPTKEFNPILHRRKTHQINNEKTQRCLPSHNNNSNSKAYSQCQTPLFNYGHYYKNYQPMRPQHLQPSQCNHHYYQRAINNSTNAEAVFVEPVYTQQISFNSPVSNYSTSSSSSLTLPSTAATIQTVPDYTRQYAYISQYSPNSSFTINSLTNSPQIYPSSLLQVFATDNHSKMNEIQCEQSPQSNNLTYPQYMYTAPNIQSSPQCVPQSNPVVQPQPVVAQYIQPASQQQQQQQQQQQTPQHPLVQYNGQITQLRIQTQPTQQLTPTIFLTPATTQQPDNTLTPNNYQYIQQYH